MSTKKPLSFGGVHQFLRTLFADDLHAKRVLSLAGATMGVVKSASFAVAMIGKGLALARGGLTKHAIPLDALASGKQVDRLLSNPGIDVDALLVHWVPHVVGSRSSITVAMDWTDFDADGQAMIMLSLLCRHGRATPLVWLTVGTAMLKDRRNACEDRVLMRRAEVLPAGVRVRIVADRGFGDQKLYRMLAEELKFDFVIRFRGNIKVTAADGEARPAAGWVGAGGRARVLRGIRSKAAQMASNDCRTLGPSRDDRKRCRSNWKSCRPTRACTTAEPRRPAYSRNASRRSSGFSSAVVITRLPGARTSSTCTKARQFASRWTSAWACKRCRR